MRALIVAIGLVIELAGCDALDSRSPGICGNDVLETTEDCDGRVRPEQAGSGVTCAAPGEAHECRYVCGGAASCPAGWGCGTDGVCRFASGRYEIAPAITPGIGTVSIGDVDGDGRSELLVSGVDEAHALVSVGDGSFVAGTSIPLAWFKPKAAFGDVDGDGRTDLIAGNNYGIVEFRGQPSGELAPFVHPRFRAPVFPQTPRVTGTMQTSLPLQQTEFPEQHLVEVAQVPSTGHVQVQFRDQQFAAEGAPVDLGADMLTSFVGTNADLDGNGLDELVMVRWKATQFDVLVPVMSTTGQPRVTSVTRQTVSLPAAAELGVLVADADGDGTRDVLVLVAGYHVAVAPGLGGGALGPAVLAPAFDTVLSGTSLSIGLPFTAIDLGTAGKGWVTRVGIVTGGTTPTLIDGPTSPWIGAVTGDFNHDGLADVAAITSGRPNIDVWLQAPTHLFGHGRITTAFPPLGILPGDFDGDGTIDLAFLDGVGPYQIEVSYGGPQGLGGPVPVGTWRQIDAVNFASLQPTPGIRRDAAADLIVQGVLDSAPTDEVSLTYLIGTAQRQMIGAYITRTETPVPALITGDFSLVGHFGSPGSFAPDAIRDVAVMGYGPVDPAQPDVEGLFAAVAVGTGDGNLIDPALRLTASKRVVPDVDVMNAPFDPGTGISQCSTWNAADLDGDGLDELLGVMSSRCSMKPQIFIGHPDGAGGISFRSDMLPLDQLVAGAPSRVQATDIDGDGQREIVVSASVSVTVYFRSATGEYEPVVLPDTLGAPFDAVAINADDDPQLELVGQVVAPAGTDNLVVFELGADGRSFVAKARAGLIDGGGRLFAVDIDGDRVDDLVAQGPDPRNIGGAEVLRVMFGVPH